LRAFLNERTVCDRAERGNEDADPQLGAALAKPAGPA
jgi:hypothetical protein